MGIERFAALFLFPRLGGVFLASASGGLWLSSLSGVEGSAASRSVSTGGANSIRSYDTGIRALSRRSITT